MLSSLNQSFGYDVFLHREVKPIYCYMHLFIMSKAYLLEGSIVSTVEENWMLLKRECQWNMRKAKSNWLLKPPREKKFFFKIIFIFHYDLHLINRYNLPNYNSKYWFFIIYYYIYQKKNWENTRFIWYEKQNFHNLNQ